MTDNSNRREVAHWARQYLSGTLSFVQFSELVQRETEDEEIAELLDLIVHEPKQGGLFGAGPQEYARYMGRVRALVDVLANGAGSGSAG